MTKTLLPALAVLTVAAMTACSENAPEPVAIDTDVLIASASVWTPADITRDLEVDGATRQQIEASLSTLHTTMLELRARHETAAALDGEAREVYMETLQQDVQAIHEEHRALWDSLDPAVRETLHERLHERMHEHDDGALKSFHARMRRLHGDQHGHN